MSEHAKHSGERQEVVRPKEHETEHEHRREHDKSHEKASSSEQLPDVETLEAAAKANALRTEQVSQSHEHQAEPEPIIGTQRIFKASAYKHTLKKVRSHLKPVEKTFSKLIHQPVIEAASELGAKSAARPSGLLGGGLVALLGSAILLFMSKYYGFRYNFFVFVMLFIAGFALGIALELAARSLRKKS